MDQAGDQHWNATHRAGEFRGRGANVHDAKAIFQAAQHGASGLVHVGLRCRIGPKVAPAVQKIFRIQQAAMALNRPLQHQHLVAQMGVIARFFPGMIVAGRIREAGDAAKHLLDLFAIVNPVGTKGKGVAGECSKKHA